LGAQVKVLLEQYQAAMEAQNVFDFNEDLNTLLGDIPKAIELRSSSDARE
jgi:hypothetical protein